MYFNLHNIVLASHPEVRLAMAMAIDHQALIQQARHGFASLLCTDHPSAMHPGYQPSAPCPVFDPVAANKLLDDSGWARGLDGVRAKAGQRLEFEDSTTATYLSWRLDDETIIQRNFQEIGIKLDLQNYTPGTFFVSILPQGKASPPTGARAGRFDIAEYAWGYGYDPDDSGLLGCDQFPPKGLNYTFYCNPALDALYQQELATVDPGLRQEIFRQIHQIYLRDLPFIVFFSFSQVMIVRKGTHNYQPSPLEGETANIWEWWCGNGKC
jgi:peptide/nickel transport system substrate-binding protein